MGKVSGSYPSVILGVSQQVPQDRRPGQHFDQVNMISDPVRGLCRRPGSINMDEFPLTTPVTNVAAVANDTSQYRTFDFTVGQEEYAMMYRTLPRGVSNVAPFFVFNKTTGAFIPSNISDPTGNLMATMAMSGISAAVNIGRFVFMAANGFVVQGDTTPRWSAFDNASRGVVWIRGGSFSRTYRLQIAATVDGAPFTFEAEYSTPSASYPGILDTSDIPAGDDYQRLVNDRTNAYNTAVNQWIGTSAAAIQPAAIAQGLIDNLNANYPAQYGAFWRLGSTIVIGFNTIPGGSTILDIMVNDGGDGTLMKGVGQTVASVDDLPPVHHHGKVVRIQPRDSSKEVFYMEAIGKNPLAGHGEVTWREGIGEDFMPAQSEVLIYATVHNGTFYVAPSGPHLAAATGTPVPSYVPRKVGDGVGAPFPTFIGRAINYLGLFQDRLVVGSGAVLFFSRPGDYLNWFRKSVLTVVDSDPVEIYALGSEDDVITASVTFDRNLMLFGRKNQYVINGKQPLTPSTASAVAVSAYEEAVNAYPIASGNYGFYAKKHGGATTLHQVQTGLVVDAPESTEISRQLDTYLEGSPIQIAAMTSPNNIFLRTSNRYAVYVYTYMDNEAQGQRLFDSWSKWSWDPVLGHCIGMSVYNQELMVFTLRRRQNDAGSSEQWFVAADSFSLDTRDTSRPFLDSARLWTQVSVPGLARWLNPDALSVGQRESLFSAYGDTIPSPSRALMAGSKLDYTAELMAQYPTVPANTLWVGAGFPAYVEPTNPYPRDSNDRAIVNGRLTLVKYNVSVTNTGGMEALVASFGKEYERARLFNGRIVGRDTNLVGRVPIVSEAVSVPVGRETREFKYRLAAVSWLPLTITAIEWTGQHFYNQRRM